DSSILNNQEREMDRGLAHFQSWPQTQSQAQAQNQNQNQNQNQPEIQNPDENKIPKAKEIRQRRKRNKKMKGRWNILVLYGAKYLSLTQSGAMGNAKLGTLFLNNLQFHSEFSIKNWSWILQ